MSRLLPLIVLIIWSFTTGCDREPSTPPNVVLIMADDLGYGDLSTYDGWIETPNIDRIAQEGALFTDYHANGPVCSPTRAALLTGKYQQRSGIPGVIYADPARNRHHGLHVSEVTFADRVRDVGYATGIQGKWHLGYREEFNPVRNGFDTFNGYVSGNVDFFSKIDGVGVFDWWRDTTLVDVPGYVTHLINQHSVDFIREHAEEPFLLYVPHEAPHYPYQGPNDEAFRIVGERVPEVRDSAQVVRAYREMVEVMDDGVGQILDTLDELGLAENTIVIFISDNGAVGYGSNGALRGFKNSLWEGGIRVPGMVRWPGVVEAGTVLDEPMTGLDITATILKAAGASVDGLDGADMSGYWSGTADLPERDLFWEYQSQRVVRRGDWKWTSNPRGQEGEFLYNLRDDVSERKDLAADHPDLVTELRDAFAAWQTDVMDGATEQPSAP